MTGRALQKCRHLIAGFAIATVLVFPCRAAVGDAAANGFSVSESAHVAAPPGKVYAALIAPGRWWSPLHTFSKNAANLSLDAKAGGCWRETLPDGGSVCHLAVVYADPGKALVLRGALGPLQGLGVEGAMSVQLKPAGTGTDLTLVYNVGGYLKEGLAGWAVPVDQVLGEQVGRLKSLVETGSPAPKP
ncbi:MAG TPA: SRPBCC family protein [Rhizomicrobium sp.]